ncbi:MAG: hypothetical protein QOE28_2758 [Solirubrobacteraceae bacterium]|nr:hypothetical protein [Solirubrobacteraceae bacterium]
MTQTGRLRRSAAAGVIALLTVAAFATAALAHVERTSYWPDPRPDTSVKPAAGGAPPKVRSLYSGLPGKRDKRSKAARKFKAGRSYKARDKQGKVRVVCLSTSLRKVKADIRLARTRGYRDRPTQALQRLSKKAGARLLAYNKTFFRLCGFHQIQPAVTASTNNDRVVVMPGVYTEPKSRKIPSFPPECEKYRTTSEKGSGAVSYPYQFYCPNAQALVSVIGRALGPGTDPQSSPTGRPDPHGIPNVGPCIRCNFQIEGSGPSAVDTVIDAGNPLSGDGAPLDSKKDVALKADRADGFVLKDMTVRHAAEHDVYVLETDGYQLIRNRYMYGGEYGTLTFASDHGITKICEASGNGDSGLYPGGAPDTGAAQAQRPDFYPERRLNQLITRCDSHHNNLGYSGTMGNATHVYKNNFYDNTTGIATDSFYAGGHPGFPQDSAVFEDNNIYSNNFNIYAPHSDVASSTPVPIGVGIMIAGGNGNTVIGNHIYDNWRRGTMLLAVPDAISCTPAPGAGSPPCTPQGASSTSNDNEYHGNVMGLTPSGEAIPNGVDFWWDEFPGNTGNCWGPNTGSDGQADHTTSDPPESPTGDPAPGFIAKRNCGSPLNRGKGNSAKEAVLVACAEQVEGTQNGQTSCDWFNPPPKPGSGGSSAQSSPALPVAASAAAFPQLPSHCVLLGNIGGTLTCDLFVRRLG